MCNFLKGRSALNKLKLITRLLRTHKPGNPVFLIVLFFALTVILTTGCGGTSSSKNLSAGPSPIVDDLESGRIKGTVTSAVTGNIIKGAIVETFEKQAVAGDDGSYLLGPLPAGDYRVIARASGYEPIVKDDVRVIAGRITENVDYKLNTQVASYSPDFAVLAVLPYLGTDGDEVTIYCRGCGSEKGRVTFNGKDATIIDWNTSRDDRILVRVPAEVETGPVRVIINGETSKEAQPQLFTGKPVILAADPAIARGGQSINLYGRNFNPNIQNNRVRLGDDSCTVTDVLNTATLQVQLPLNAETGIISVRIESVDYQLDGISNVVMTIIPELVHMSPRRSVPNVPLTLYGYNFGEDKSVVKVFFGAYIIQPGSFLTFSNNRISFTVPDNTVLAAGNSTEVKVQVNDAQSNSLTYTAYNNSNNTLTDYGIYDFSAVSTGGRLHLPTLRPNERIAFLSVLSGTKSDDLTGSYGYAFAGYLGGNYTAVPVLPGNIKRSVVHGPSGQSMRYLYDQHNLSAFSTKSSLRGALTDPAPDTLSLYLRDFQSADPFNNANDIPATATLKVTGDECLVYLDIQTSGIADSDAQAIADKFDNYYNTIATAFGVLNPPEGNIDAQSRIAVVVSPKLEDPSAEIKTVAYFDPRDKTPAALNSLGTEVLYANAVEFPRDPDQFYAGIVGTLHKIIYLNQKSFEMTAWQLIGLSVFAREVVGLGFSSGNEMDQQWVAQYLKYPEEVSLNQWPDQPGYNNYGMQFLFAQYIYDRCGGYAAIRKLETLSGRTGLDDIETNVVSSANPAVSNGIKDFFHDFCRALFFDDLNLNDSFWNAEDKNKYQFKSISLRGKHPSIEGLQGLTLNEDPIARSFEIKGWGCRLVEYSQGNWGDLEVTIGSTPTVGDFKTWVIYYSSEQVATGTQ